MQAHMDKPEGSNVKNDLLSFGGASPILDLDVCEPKASGQESEGEIGCDVSALDEAAKHGPFAEETNTKALSNSAPLDIVHQHIRLFFKKDSSSLSNKMFLIYKRNYRLLIWREFIEAEHEEDGVWYDEHGKPECLVLKVENYQKQVLDAMHDINIWRSASPTKQERLEQHDIERIYSSSPQYADYELHVVG